MNKLFSLALLTLFAAVLAYGQRDKPADAAELAEITRRGKALAAYDVAAWHSTDAVRSADPKLDGVEGYVGHLVGEKWTVAYGRLNETKDKYLIVHEAVQQSSPTEFKVTSYAKPKQADGFFLFAARAMELAKDAFTPAEDRPYNVAVLADADDMFFVYFKPAQTEVGVFPLGGDIRFTVSGDGREILSTRQLHRSIIEFRVPEGVTPQTGYHTAILDDAPEDTDVFHVLVRRPKVPELIVTSKFVYQVAIDGTIRYLMTAEAFKKIGNK